jgi:hypothetical protein
MVADDGRKGNEMSTEQRQQRAFSYRLFRHLPEDFRESLELFPAFLQEPRHPPALELFWLLKPGAVGFGISWTAKTSTGDPSLLLRRYPGASAAAALLLCGLACVLCRRSGDSAAVAPENQVLARIVESTDDFHWELRKQHAPTKQKQLLTN